LRDPGSPRWTKWRELLVRMARGHYHLSEPDADDVAQDVLARVFRRLDAIREPNAFASYLLAALRNGVLQSHRPPAHVSIHASMVPGAPPIEETVADDSPSAETQMHCRERRRLLERELERICAARRHPERDRRIAFRVFLEECKSGTVAREMGLNPQTVYNVTFRILEALDPDLRGEVA
jgi:RNA polymerase sigma factor (sigma-70 family)